MFLRDSIQNILSNWFSKNEMTIMKERYFIFEYDHYGIVYTIKFN